MPPTSKTFSLVGDLKKSTTTVKTHSILSFSSSIASNEQVVVNDIVDHDTTDQAVSLGGLQTATMLVIILDDALDGWLKFKLNGSATALPVKKFLALMDTSITSLSVTNDSGNQAGYSAFMA